MGGCSISIYNIAYIVERCKKLMKEDEMFYLIVVNDWQTWVV